MSLKQKEITYEDYQTLSGTSSLKFDKIQTESAEKEEALSKMEAEW